MTASTQRYTAVAIVLHWAIALAIFGQIALAWWMTDAIGEAEHQAQATAAYQLHKSIGLTVLLLSIVRLIWRLTHKPPGYPAHMPAWEKLIARLSHWAFYVLMIGLPLTGWLYVSTGWSSHTDRPLDVPTLYFGLFQVPHLFDLNHLADSTRAFLSKTIGLTHWGLAWSAIGLAALHVGAALKHHFVDRDDVLTHMVPGLQPLGGAPATPPPERGRAPILIGGFAAIALAFGALTFAFLNPPGASPAIPAQEHAETVEHADAVPLPAPTADETTAPDATAPVVAGPPPVWTVDRGASSIHFTGTHAGNAFEGAFSRWRADIRFDPNNLDASSARVTIETASASDGVPLHDQSLPQEEWFDVANHPTAIFRTTRIRARGANTYEARGSLTLKGQPITLALPFTLRFEGDRAIMEGTASIDRREADLGQASDPDAEFVSREIGIVVHVEARRTP
ncbi:MAG: cytochrome b/b6 domain-containing protein [Terricaulis sp.]